MLHPYSESPSIWERASNSVYQIQYFVQMWTEISRTNIIIGLFFYRFYSYMKIVESFARQRNSAFAILLASLRVVTSFPFGVYQAYVIQNPINLTLQRKTWGLQGYILFSLIFSRTHRLWVLTSITQSLFRAKIRKSSHFHCLKIFVVAAIKTPLHWIACFRNIEEEVYFVTKQHTNTICNRSNLTLEQKLWCRHY